MLLPGRLLLRSRNYVRRLHVRDGLSAHEIGRQLGVSHSTVLDAIQAFGLNGSVRRNGGKKLKGQIPFGYMLVDCKLQKCPEEQTTIRLIRQLRASGKTLRSVADELNRHLVPTKNHGIWQAATVKKILDRVVAGTSA